MITRACLFSDPRNDPNIWPDDPAVLKCESRDSTTLWADTSYPNSSGENNNLTLPFNLPPFEAEITKS